MASSRYFAHGKLLITGEYSVLKGALALAIPTRLGQYLEFEAGGNNIFWQSYNSEDKLWFEATYTNRAHIVNTNDLEKAQLLQNILLKASGISRKELPAGKVKTWLEFPNKWGLGSSSTLLYLISKWLNVDAMELFFGSMSGSGYDIACAGENEPILYRVENQKPSWITTSLPPAFRECYFVYLNQKKLSAPEVARLQKEKTDPSAIEDISRIIRLCTQAGTAEELAQLMDEHEKITAAINHLPPVKQQLFPDFEGSVKSLGAWGGDFIMALGSNSAQYFNQKGYPVHFKFNDIAAKKV